MRNEPKNTPRECCGLHSTYLATHDTGIEHLYGTIYYEGTYNAGANHVSEQIELELIRTQMAQKPALRAVGMRVRCANKASAE